MYADTLGRLITEGKLAAAGGPSYVYDGGGRRVRKAVGGVTTVLVYDAGGRLVAEYGGAASQTSGTSYVTQDTLGSTRVVTGQGGEVRGRYDYLPFGEEVYLGRSNYGGNDIRQKFTRKERDVETGLDYFGARYYSSTQGRFLGADNVTYSKTVDPQTWNQYSYCRSGPLNRIDPDGHNWFYINKSWEWHDGDTYDYTYTDKKGKEHTRTLHSDYTHLIIIVVNKDLKTSSGGYQATLTVFGKGPEDIRAQEATAYTGSGHNQPVPDGNYIIDIGSVSYPFTETVVKGKNGDEALAHRDGLQYIANNIAGDERLNFQPIWGTMRANLAKAVIGGDGQPVIGGSTSYYIHGHDSTARSEATLGCVGTPEERVLNWLFNVAKQREGASLRVPVNVKTAK